VNAFAVVGRAARSGLLPPGAEKEPAGKFVLMLRTYWRNEKSP
jgi:hypothetical protein